MIFVAHENGKSLILAGTVRLATDTIKIALMETFTPASFQTNTYWSDVSAGEITPTGSYEAGGVALTGAAASVDTGTEEGVMDFADVLITSLTATWQYMVVYKSTGNAATSPLLYYIDTVTPVTKTGKTTRILWSASGVVRLL